jgi:hypothetical protein
VRRQFHSWGENRILKWNRTGVAAAASGTLRSHASHEAFIGIPRIKNAS